MLELIEFRGVREKIYITKSENQFLILKYSSPHHKWIFTRLLNVYNHAYLYLPPYLLFFLHLTVELKFLSFAVVEP